MMHAPPDERLPARSSENSKANRIETSERPGGISRICSMEVVKNSEENSENKCIMLVDFAITAERDQHMPPIAAIREACLLRFRPILMTTAAAMLAGVPLAFGHGTGSEMRQPLGYAMVGGLALSQLLTLYTTPVVYLYLDRVQVWLRGDKHAPQREPQLIRAEAAE